VIAARDLAPGDEEKIGKTIMAIQVEDVNDNVPIIEIDLIVESNGSAGVNFIIIFYFVECVISL